MTDGSSIDEISDEEFEAAKAEAIARWGVIPPSLQRIIDQGGRFGKSLHGRAWPEDAEERSVDEINEGVRQALADLDGSRLSTISLLTGISTEKLIELGGVYDGEQPAVRAVRDHAAGEQDVP